MYTTTGGYYYQSPIKAKKVSNIHIQRRPTSHFNKKTLRLLFLVILIAISFTFGAMMNVYASDTDETSSLQFAPSYSSHSVDSGETLWSIAKIYLPEDTDIRAFIHDIKVMNGLKSSMLQQGQLLQIPVQR